MTSVHIELEQSLYESMLVPYVPASVIEAPETWKVAESADVGTNTR